MLVLLVVKLFWVLFKKKSCKSIFSESRFSMNKILILDSQHPKIKMVTGMC